MMYETTLPGCLRARTASASPVMLGMIKAQRSVERRKVELRGVPVKRPETLELFVAEEVPNIIAQVLLRHRFAGRIVRKVRARHVGRVRDTLVASPLQGLDLLRRHRIGPAGPERIHKRQTRRTRPEVSKVDLLNCRFQEQ